jgi:hypothetical protein
VTLNFSVFDVIVDEEKYIYSNQEGIEQRVSVSNPIQSSINYISNNQWIYVKEGIYTEKMDDDKAILINKPLNLRSNGSAVLNPSTVKYLIDISTDGNNQTVYIDGFIIESNWTVTGIRQGYSTPNKENTPVKIINNFIKASEFPSENAANTIQVYGENSEVINNIIYVATQKTSYTSTAIYLEASNSIIRGNTIISEKTDITNVGIAVSRYSSNSLIFNITLEDNTIIGCVDGIRLSILTNTMFPGGLDNVMIKKNTFIDTINSIKFNRLNSLRTGVISNVTFNENTFYPLKDSSSVQYAVKFVDYNNDDFFTDEPDLNEFISKNIWMDVIPVSENDSWSIILQES